MLLNRPASVDARDDKHLLRFQKLLASYELLIVDELGYVLLSKTGADRIGPA
jgi:DNA replication protein DnaC